MVDTAKGDLTTVRLGFTETEGEDRFIDETLVDHAVEGRSNVVDGDGIVGKAEDTVEPSSRVNHDSLTL